MKLLIDIGNTNTVYCIYDNSKCVYKKRFENNTEIKPALNKICDFNIKAIGIASVVPDSTQFNSKLLLNHLNIKPFIVNWKNSNISFDVDKIDEVGVDRICNAKAAVNKTNDNCIVIDFGTATTYDVIDENSTFLGGAIAPGIKVSAMNLINKAALLENTVLEFPKKYISKNTQTNIQSGVMFGAIHSIEGMIENIKHEIKVDSKIILTGGFSNLISPRLTFPHTLEPNLTMDGINLILEENNNG